MTSIFCGVRKSLDVGEFFSWAWRLHPGRHSGSGLQTFIQSFSYRYSQGQVYKPLYKASVTGTVGVRLRILKIKYPDFLVLILPIFAIFSVAAAGVG